MKHPKILIILAIVVIITFLVILETEIGMPNSQIQLQRTMASFVRKQICQINLEEFLIVLYVSPYIIGWANDCPNKVQDTSDDVNITLFSQEMHECYMTKFVGETLNCTVLDSGCTKNVCGESWLTNYLDILTASDRSKAVVEKCSNSFRFCDRK